MTVLRRLDAVLEPTKQAVSEMKATLDKAGVANQDVALRQAAGQAFYNTSQFTLRDLRARASQQQLRADFEAYLESFSPNVLDTIENFEFRNQIPRLSKADALGTLIEKFLEPSINLGPYPVKNGDGSIKHPGLDNHAMGTIFEELVRRFNEENNEEAGEHWTPRDAVKLMARLLFLPIADQIESGTYLLYDGACGTGGMLTVAEETLQQLAQEYENINFCGMTPQPSGAFGKGQGLLDKEAPWRLHACVGLEARQWSRFLPQCSKKRISARKARCTCPWRMAGSS